MILQYLGNVALPVDLPGTLLEADNPVLLQKLDWCRLWHGLPFHRLNLNIRMASKRLLFINKEEAMSPVKS